MLILAIDGVSTHLIAEKVLLRDSGQVSCFLSLRIALTTSEPTKVSSSSPIILFSPGARKLTLIKIAAESINTLLARCLKVVKMFMLVSGARYL